MIQPNRWLPPLLLILIALLAPPAALGKPAILDERLHHLRAGERREWSDFPAQAEGPNLSLSFQADRNAGEATLRLRQQDVKQTWKVLLNNRELARLPPDENDMVIYLAVPAGELRSGDNHLVIEPDGRTPDDVRIGEITLDDRPRSDVLSEATVEVAVLEAVRTGSPATVPCRLTILNDRGALMSVGAASGAGRAVRPGVIYTADGRARFGLPAGDYTLFAGRGFAYSIDSVKVSLRRGDTIRKTLTLRREVPTDGWASCDTHVHTLTYSGHGDASAEERVVTIAGEGLELPVATEHNRQIDYRAAAVKQGVSDRFTLVVGNEVTTNVGHFNIFPAPAGGSIPDFLAKDWKTLFSSIAERTGAKMIVLNHPRDLHAGFRPFGPERHVALTGEDLDGWELRANGVEVVNSGAQQSDVMRPFHDWFGLLDRGLKVAPVGASDSHDVSRYIVGQGRTYIRCRNDHPQRIDIEEAAKSFAAGRVLVSCGLLADITVNGKYGPGDLVPASREVKVAVRVLGPSWTTADRVLLYANGVKVREERIADGKKAGIKWQGEWTLPPFRHDTYLVAIASGPGVTGLYWPIARPYQPTSPLVTRRVIGATGAVWLDSDGDGRRTSARGYAERLLREAGGDGPKAVKALADYNEAVATQVAALLRVRGVSPRDAALQEAVRKAGAHVERAFAAYAEAWRDCEIARARPR